MNRVRIKNIVNRWKGQAKDFSISIALGDIVCSTVLRKSNGPLKHSINEKYYNKAKDIILQRYQYVVDKWNVENDVSILKNFNKKLPIYIFWWQSIEDAPGLIVSCIDRIKELAENPVIVVDKNNWSELVDLPKFAVNAVNTGNISLTTFSDILRYNLLAKTGGMWIDPTCYLSHKFDEEVYEYPFYTINHGDIWEHPICKGKWSTFFLCSGENNPLFGFISDMINEYWKNEKSLAVYLLPDVFFSIGYENIPYIKKVIDIVPENNRDRVKLIKMLSQSKGKNFDELVEKVDKQTYIHKLTYKTYIEKFDGDCR